MKTLVSLVFGATLVAQAALAHAIVPFAPVRTQIRQEAKAEGAMKNLIRPSLRVQIKGDKATAQIYSMGQLRPRAKPTRMLQKTATFKIDQLMDGQLAQPVKTSGRVWHQVMRLSMK